MFCVAVNWNVYQLSYEVFDSTHVHAHLIVSCEEYVYYVVEKIPNHQTIPRVMVSKYSESYGVHSHILHSVDAVANELRMKHLVVSCLLCLPRRENTLQSHCPPLCMALNECLLKCVLQQWVSGEKQVEMDTGRSQEEQGEGGDGMVWKERSERRVLKQQSEEQRQGDGGMVALEGVKREDEAEVVQHVEKVTHQSLC